MSIIFSVVLLVSLYIIFRINKYYSKQSEKKFNQRHQEIIQNIKTNWNRISIKTSDCQIIKYDTIIDKNKKIDVFEKRTFLEVLNKNPHRQILINEKRSKLICNQKENGEIIRNFEKIVLIDTTVFEFKLRIRDFIDVYEQKENGEEYYYIDLEFLDEPFDSKNYS
ncbi:hypothetical protein GCM10023115_24850 [Pontixanthobacter gangjinensis]|uniref:Uncharacterized protein n=1 Tax=Christiangramia aestuarii TaxID=1028746 RepID=A0A7K1LSV0_9FLAO|nr:hypothetical protein [Christiangramia aestuarii]MUP43882.1 hypothetical protein [Christiangramia aestuarii]